MNFVPGLQSVNNGLIVRLDTPENLKESTGRQEIEITVMKNDRLIKS